MNYNTDGFNERTNFIHNSNDLNRSKSNPKSFDTSVVEMKISENKADIKTYNKNESLNSSTREYKNINQFNLFNNYKSRGIKK